MFLIRMFPTQERGTDFGQNQQGIFWGVKNDGGQGDGLEQGAKM